MVHSPILLPSVVLFWWTASCDVMEESFYTGHYLKLQKIMFFQPVDIDLWPWPSNPSKILSRYSPSPNFGCACQVTLPEEHRQVETQTDKKSILYPQPLMQEGITKLVQYLLVFFCIWALSHLSCKTLNFREHLIFAQIRRAVGQGGQRRHGQLQMAITSSIMVRLSKFKNWFAA